MMSYQFFEMVAESYRERERALLREAQIDRLLRGDHRPLAARKRVAMRVGVYFVRWGCWLQQRAGVAKSAA